MPGAPSSITVTVLFFSVLREKTGTHELAFSLDRQTTGEDLLDGLEARFPAVGEHRSSVRLAVNQTYSPADAPLRRCAAALMQLFKIRPRDCGIAPLQQPD